MAASGPWTWLNKAIGKPFDGTMDLDSHAFKIALLNATQSIDATFVGASGNAQYGDLTGELATASGYTNGGLALSGLSVGVSGAGSRVWTASDASWALSGSIAFKYGIIWDDTLANKDLLCFFDVNPGGGTISTSVNPLVIALSTGILNWHT